MLPASQSGCLHAEPEARACASCSREAGGFFAVCFSSESDIPVGGVGRLWRGAGVGGGRVIAKALFISLLIHVHRLGQTRSLHAANG